MAKMMGISINKMSCMGRVVGNPVVDGGWATLQLKTVVPEPKADNSGWEEVEMLLPFITNNPKTIETVQKFVQDERQLYLEGYVKTWDGGWGIVITMIKLGSKTMYDPDAQEGNNQQKRNNVPR